MIASPRESQPLPTLEDTSSSGQPLSNDPFAQLLIDLMNILSEKPGVLERMQAILETMVLILQNGEVAKLVESTRYKEATTVAAFFRAMAPYWNHVTNKLLRTVIVASGCDEAIQKVNEFQKSRDPNAVIVAVQQHSATPTSDTSSSSATAAVASPSPTVPRPGGIMVTAKIRGREISILSDYDSDLSIVSSLLRLPEEALTYDSTGRNSIILRWKMSAELLPYVKSVLKSTTPCAGIVRECVNRQIIELRVGEDVQYNFPTLKVMKITNMTVIHLHIVYAYFFDPSPNSLA